MGVMFVQAERAVELPFAVAMQGLVRAIDDGGLVAESQRAVADGLVFVMPVGPRGGRVPRRDVLVRLLPGRATDRSFRVPLRWEAIGAGGRLFPDLDADLELTAGEQPGTSRLSIIGRYSPPLGPVGEAVDRAVMSKVASVTMAALLREVAEQLGRWTSGMPRPNG
jgi:hypothetical protein